VQEVGVDEPDIVKTDGKRILAVSGNQLQVVDVTGPKPGLASTLDLGAYGARLLVQGNTVLAVTDVWNRVVVGPVPGAGGRPYWGPPSQPRTQLTLIDLADPAKPVIRSRVQVDGQFVDGRLVGGRARLVTTLGVPNLPFVGPSDYTEAALEAARLANVAVVRESSATEWLPKAFAVDAAGQAAVDGKPLMGCDDVSHPETFSGFNTLSVLSVDLARPQLDTADSVGVVGSGQTVYASAANLYVTSTGMTAGPGWAVGGGGGGIAVPPGGPATGGVDHGVAAPDAGTAADHDGDGKPDQGGGATPGVPPDRDGGVAPTDPVDHDGGGKPGSGDHEAPPKPDPGDQERPEPTTPPPPPPPPPPTRTSIHVFDVSRAGPATYRASGTVEGALLNQWSLSEQGTDLRVVTTIGSFACGGCNGDSSRLSVLRRQGDQLTLVGSVDGMGRGEAVKAVRFTGDRAYVVTFRQTDPLYVVDLGDPTRPRIAGELKVPGYSAYLHPVGDGRVLGIGRDATEEGRITGLKVALYDVRDAGQPKELVATTLPTAGTSVEYTAKAFLWWAPERLAVIPVSDYGGTVRPDGSWEPGFSGVIGFNVGDATLAERGRVTNEPREWGPAEITRSVVVGDRLFTISDNGVRVSGLASLAPQGWVAFPTAAVVTPPPFDAGGPTKGAPPGG
jgi:hypothetical protein